MTPAFQRVLATVVLLVALAVLLLTVNYLWPHLLHAGPRGGGGCNPWLDSRC